MSQLFPRARELFATGQLDWTSQDFAVRAVMLPPSWVPDFDNDVYLSSIPAGVRIAVSGPISDRTVTAGWCDGSAADFGIVSDTRLVAQIVLFTDTEDESTSLLLAHLDELEGEPFAPAGVQYLLYPDAQAGGFFRV
jgi:hypothetical protein